MLNTMDKIYFKTKLQAELMKNTAKRKWNELKEDEVGGTATVVIEIVMIGAILVLGYVFREAIGGLFKSLWEGLVKFTGDGDATTLTPPSVENPFG